MVGEEHPCQYKLTSTVLKGNKTNEKGINSFLCMCVYIDPLIKCRSVVDDRKSFFYENTPGNRMITTLQQVPVVQKVDSAIQWITQMNSLILIC